MKEKPVLLEKMEELAIRLEISAKELYKYSNFPERYYKIKEIPKKRGGYRKITIPCDNLKNVQRWILKKILYKKEIHRSANGFVKEKSIITNAKEHLNKKIVYNLDLKDFFPSIKIHKVYEVFKKMGYNKKMCVLLSKLCTYEGRLPQGAPTSPYLSNIILYKLDKRLERYAKRVRLTYTRYADDLTFSGKSLSKSSRKFIKKIINSEGFEINLLKERIALKSTRQEVTGLVVNGDKLSVPKDKERYLRQQIYYCKTKGVFDNLLFQKKEEISNYSEHLYGLARFIKMVDERKGKKYMRELDMIDWQS